MEFFHFMESTTWNNNNKTSKDKNNFLLFQLDSIFLHLAYPLLLKGHGNGGSKRRDTMITVKANAEYKLKDMLESIKPARAAWRAQCFHFSLLHDKIDISDLHKIAFGLITNELADKDSSVFFMSDDDIIVLSKSVPKKIFDGIATEIQYHIPDKIRLGLELPFAITLDVGVSWDELYDIAAEKLNSMLARLETLGEATIARTEESAGYGKKPVHDALARRMARGKTCILVVEDDPLSLHITRKALMENDYMVVSAEDGLNARQAYMLHAPDVVFLDIGLPDISGHQVLKDLLNIDPTAYIVMLSANSTREDILKAMQAGAKGFIGKPFSKAKLNQYIAQSPTVHMPGVAAWI